MGGCAAAAARLNQLTGCEAGCPSHIVTSGLLRCSWPTPTNRRSSYALKAPDKDGVAHGDEQTGKINGCGLSVRQWILCETGRP